MSSPPPAPRRVVPASLVVKFALLVALLACGVVLVRFTPVADYLTREAMTGLLARLRGAWWSPGALVGLFAVVAPLGLPVSPLVLAGGAVFGTLWGALWNTIGLFVGAAVSYAVALLLGRDLVAHFAGERLQRVERLFERHGFWPLVQVRFVPLPFALVNFGAALAGVKAPMFLLATAVGLAPATLVHTFFADRLVRAEKGDHLPLLLTYLTTLALLALATALPTIRARWLRRRRYRELLERRQNRSS